MFRRQVERALAASGVTINGPNPWDLQVHDPRAFRRIVLEGSMGAGESYVDGLWDCQQLDEMVARVLRSSADEQLPDWQHSLLRVQSAVFNLQTRRRAPQVAEVHYNLGNDFFATMLGPSMTYSCGYWAEATTLDEAQDAKIELVARKMQLRPGMRVLDVGSGWGRLLRVLAERYGIEGVGITVSPPQQEFAAAAAAGLPLRYQVADWRDPSLKGPFDRIVSVGMFEHVGRKNYPAFFTRLRQLLRPDGLVLLHTIGNDHTPSDPWLHQYIFPNGELPSSTDLARAVTGRFVIEDWHNFRADYARTIRCWYSRFLEHSQGLERRFIRLWSYYLLGMAGGFAAGNRNQLWQLVLSPAGVPEGYRSPR